MYVTLLSSTCFGPWHAHPQEEQLPKHSIWYPRSPKQLYTTPVESGLLCSPLSTGVVYSKDTRCCVCACSSWGWACQGPKHVEDSNVTYMLLVNCALKLVEQIILYYVARSKKHQNCYLVFSFHLCNGKQTSEGCRFSSGVLLRTTDWLTDWLNVFVYNSIEQSHCTESDVHSESF